MSRKARQRSERALQTGLKGCGIEINLSDMLRISDKYEEPYKILTG